MSLGVFGLFLSGLLLAMCGPRDTRGRTAFTALLALMLGVVIAGSDGLLVEPSHHLVDGVRSGLTSVAGWIGKGLDGPTAS